MSATHLATHLAADLASQFAPLAPILSPSPSFDVMRNSGIERGEVDVWRIDLDQLTPAAWPQALTAEEFSRADRFVQQRDHDRFLQGRFSLRTVLAAYLELAPRDLDFQFNAHGKPSLPGRYRLGFNVSHSGNLAAIAVGRQPAIGIDIERLTPPENVRRLARQVFSEEECRFLAALPDHGLTLPFLTAWTRKEALLKALGVGLTLDPRTVTVGLSRVRSRIENPLQEGTVEVTTIASDADAVLSLAICGGSAEVHSTVRIRHFRPNEKVEPGT